ncbi:MAG: hypothetical protein NZ519_05160 [Bacteroidia bacterium]|nr:hypothetical protein [Bacteroidia bacterium]
MENQNEFVITLRNGNTELRFSIAQGDLAKAAMVLVHLLQVYGIRCKVEVKGK